MNFGGTPWYAQISDHNAVEKHVLSISNASSDGQVGKNKITLNSYIIPHKHEFQVVYRY